MVLIVRIVVFIVIAASSLANRDDKVFKVCGSLLADTVAMVCEGVYNEKKRNEIKPQTDFIEPDYYYNHEPFLDTDSSYPFRSKRSTSMLKAFRTKREVRIVDECCRKSCTISEIMGYCG